MDAYRGLVRCDSTETLLEIVFRACDISLRGEHCIFQGDGAVYTLLLCQDSESSEEKVLYKAYTEMPSRFLRAGVSFFGRAYPLFFFFAPHVPVHRDLKRKNQSASLEQTVGSGICKGKFLSELPHCKTGMPGWVSFSQ